MHPSRIFDILEYQAKIHPIENCLNDKSEGKWKSTSTPEFYEKANLITAALIELGVKPDDKIALITNNNRSEWSIVDMGILQTGAVTVPLYPNISAKDYQFILHHSESIFCFVSDQEIYNKLQTIQPHLKKLKAIFSFDQLDQCQHWVKLLEQGASVLDHQKLNEVKSKVAAHDLATIIYTSGTTGTPKGVMLSHDNLVSNVVSASKKLPLQLTLSKTLSFLPVCHIFERTFLYLYLYNGLEIYFAQSLETIAQDIQEVKPHFMTTVPRMLEKIYAKIQEKGEGLKGLKRKIFFWALAVANDFEPLVSKKMIYTLKLILARQLILNKWRAALGGNIKMIASGSAPLQPKLIRLFSAAKMTVVEGYGLTETSPIISFNDIKNKEYRVGSVGKSIEGVSIKIAADGEILCKGPNIMKGYFKDPKLTQQVMQKDYFRTGDIGTLDDEGFLKITDRKKQIFKTSGGKYIAPQPIENQLKQSPLIEQIMVVGETDQQPLFNPILNNADGG
jgi:long-chain acyl-CoA synthetase